MLQYGGRVAVVWLLLLSYHPTATTSEMLPVFTGPSN